MLAGAVQAGDLVAELVDELHVRRGVRMRFAVRLRVGLGANGPSHLGGLPRIELPHDLIVGGRGEPRASRARADEKFEAVAISGGITPPQDDFECRRVAPEYGSQDCRGLSRGFDSASAPAIYQQVCLP